MSKQFNVRVTKRDDNSVCFEMMHNGEKIADLTFVEIIDMIMQFTSALRFFGTK